MIPVLLATTIEVPDSKNGAVKSTTASLSALILSEVKTMSNFLAMSSAIRPFHFPFLQKRDKNNLFILKSCKNVIKSIERQIYKEGTHIPDKDSGYDHMNDALGYLVEFNFPLKRNFVPSPQKRWS